MTSEATTVTADAERTAGEPELEVGLKGGMDCSVSGSPLTREAAS